MDTYVRRRSSFFQASITRLACLWLAACAPSAGLDDPALDDAGAPTASGGGGTGASKKDAGGSAGSSSGAGSGGGASAGMGGSAAADARPSDAAAVSAGADAGVPAPGDGGAVKPPTPITLPEPGKAPPLPVVFIETGGKSIPGTKSAMIPATIKIVEDHDGAFDAKDPKPLLARPVAFQTTIGINRHGNASDQFVDMKAYNVEFRDEKGEDQSAAVLGMGKGSDWLLLACYIDKTCMKNMLAYTLFREMGWWAPRGRHVEVFVDGKYNGLYVFFEKIRRDNDRLAIPKMEKDAADVTGSYVYKCDSPSDGPAYDWKTAGGYTLSYFRPQHDEITEPQKKYIQQITSDFDRAMASATYADPDKGYRSFIDVKSWVDYLFVNELSNNADGLLRSAFFYKVPMSMGNKIYAGPPWDYDLAFSTDLRGHDRTDVWQHVHAPAQIGNDGTHINNVKIFQVWQKLFKEPGFQKDMKCRWNEVTKTVFTPAAINAKIDGWAKDLQPATKRHHARWNVLGQSIFGNSHFVGKTWQDDINHLKSWIGKRHAWIASNLPGTCP